jgi:hypothetical protein
MNELILWDRMLQGYEGTAHYLKIIVLIGMLVVLLFRREAIVNRGVFRASYLLFGTSLLISAVASVMTYDNTNLMAQMMGQRRPSEQTPWILNILSNAVPAGLFALSVMCLLGSLLPPAKKPLTSPVAQPHPLD